ncbi:methylthioribulose 1-phosphate dehydratase [Spirulina sp. 06S082]|uniref:methylthioribulose 1-phosphate dehydratase n=1 Tax=Spirulina sp. 06S082 TaxID=3110248 RepID=UPI002B1FA33F|nr:methylthioribulose 1-phosphate dehydratase [Spirulina sp. 06S082]MEA5470306.1 methylthioribulose 1-phosphate dehydratase [Spirulina sp. 06S082]
MKAQWLQEEETQLKAIELSNAVRFFGSRGWTPATSSNFSFIADRQRNVFAISQSGRDKTQFKPEDLMLVDETGKTIEPEGAKPSAETLIHLSIYNWKSVDCVFHTHSPASTVLSKRYLKSGESFAKFREISFEGYEIQKAFAGINTHETTVTLPVFSNSQNMVEFSENLTQYLTQHLTDRDELFGFAIAGHGLYTWVNTIQMAKRNVEAWEFLFECRLLELRLG